MRIIPKNIIVIGVSTGGPKVLGLLFSGLPMLNASIVLVQHMPKFINNSFKDTLSMNTEMQLKIAEDGDVLKEGMVYIAPSDIHLKLSCNLRIRLFHGEKVNSVRPSIDIAMKSVKQLSQNKVIGIVLTGMGRDGSEGISHIKSIGGITIAEDEKSCVIYSMPKAAVETGDVDEILTPEQIQARLIELVGVKKEPMIIEA
ncbi:MAG: CheB methylesterase domain-containing protein [Halobacteriota archaeon]|nr:CheB methylesterase domain-containing protein [Halobacteriota archaeon]